MSHAQVSRPGTVPVPLPLVGGGTPNEAMTDEKSNGGERGVVGAPAGVVVDVFDA